MAERIDLSGLNMNHFTVSDAELYCKLSNINHDNIIILDLRDNKLKDISGVSIFKNLEKLCLSNNNIKDLSSLKYLTNLIYLGIDNLNLTDEIQTVKTLKNLSNLKHLFCFNTFKTIDIKNELKGIKIYDQYD